MGGEWEDKGSAESYVGEVIGGMFGVHDHAVQNTQTGETRTVYVGNEQTVGEAIANGQFNKK